MLSQPVAMPASSTMQSCLPHYEADEGTWEKLYQVTKGRVRKLLFRMDIPTSWKGQEADIVEDVVQEAIVRTLNYLKQATCQRKQIPQSLTAFALVIAKNYLRDLRRREYRLCLIHNDEVHPKEFDQEQVPALDQAIDNIETEYLFSQAAATVAQFPDKQRRAMLMDLANSMHFGKKQTTLQQAFSTVGIQLQDYQRTPSADPAERSRQAALRSLAYKRVARALSPW